MQRGSGSDAFRAAWEHELLPAVRAFEPEDVLLALTPTLVPTLTRTQVRAFEPEAIFLAAGFDAHADDPLASMRSAEAGRLRSARPPDLARPPSPWPSPSDVTLALSLRP